MATRSFIVLIRFRVQIRFWDEDLKLHIFFKLERLIHNPQPGKTGCTGYYPEAMVVQYVRGCVGMCVRICTLQEGADYSY